MSRRPFFAVGPKQTPRDLDACGLGLGLGDQAPLAITLDLIELVAIDRGIRNFRYFTFASAARERAQKDAKNGRSKTGKDNPEQHGTRRPPRELASLAIGETREARQGLEVPPRLIPGNLKKLPEPAAASRPSSRTRRAAGKQSRAPSSAGRQ